MSERDREMIAFIAALEDDEDVEANTVRIEPPRSPSQVYSIRIPVERIDQLRLMAANRDTTPTALIRNWVIERLDEEVKPHAPDRFTVKLHRPAADVTTSLLRSLRVTA
jgi:hypothetical protein